MRRRRRSLEAKEDRTEQETRNLQALCSGEDAYRRLLPRLLADGFASIDTLPRSTTTLNPAGKRITIPTFRIPVLRSGAAGWVPLSDREALEQWLFSTSWKTLRLLKFPGLRSGNGVTILMEYLKTDARSLLRW